MYIGTSPNGEAPDFIFLVTCICECIVATPLANAKGKQRDEICMLKKVHNPSKTCESLTRIVLEWRWTMA